MLTMKDVVDACAALGRFRFDAGPHGVTLLSPAPRSPNGSACPPVGDDYRIEPMSGIGGPGRWCIKRLPGGEAVSGTIETKAQLVKALREWCAEREDGPCPPDRPGFIVYACDNGVRSSLGMANAVVWRYRRVKR